MWCISLDYLYSLSAMLGGHQCIDFYTSFMKFIPKCLKVIVAFMAF
jgi:hypothetical protein